MRLFAGFTEVVEIPVTVKSIDGDKVGVELRDGRIVSMSAGECAGQLREKTEDLYVFRARVERDDNWNICGGTILEVI